MFFFVPSKTYLWTRRVNPTREAEFGLLEQAWTQTQPLEIKPTQGSQDCRICDVQTSGPKSRDTELKRLHFLHPGCMMVDAEICIFSRKTSEQTYPMNGRKFIGASTCPPLKN